MVTCARMFQFSDRFRVFAKSVGYAAYGYCVVCLFLKHCACLYRCEGESMQPTINEGRNGDIILVEFISVSSMRLARGDVVVLCDPKNPGVHICKRITAMYDDKRIYKHIKMPPGHVWVEGDNKKRSYDSRNFGPVPYGLIRGRAIYTVWPVLKRLV